VRLYGTTTSPFVRRVRVVAAEIGEPVELIDTRQPEGEAALRRVSPIAKVPVAVVDERTMFDSRAIIDWLTTVRGWGGIEPPRDRWHAANLINAIDGALEAVISVFYLKGDGHDVDKMTYCTEELDRARTIFDWLGGELMSPGRGFSAGLDLATLSLICTLDWMDFRKTYPTDRHPALAPVRAAWREHASLVATRPHT
jgi:glutathione S-transferase